MDLWKKLSKEKKKATNPDFKTTQKKEPSKPFNFLESLNLNIDALKTELGYSTDFIVRQVEFNGTALAVFYIEGLADGDVIQQSVLKPISEELKENQYPLETLIDTLCTKILTNAQVSGRFERKDLITAILSGDTLLLLDGCQEGIIIGTKGWVDRGVTEPSSQNVVRGPKDAFTETLRVNTALIRRRVKHPSLRIETKQIGRLTVTDIAIVYIDGVVDPKVVKEVHSRLDDINIDSILETGYIEEFIQDKTFTPFPTIYNSERPDAVVASILEGRVAIIVDGTPFVLTVPTLFIEFFQASEDYYQRADFASLIRLLRFMSFLMAMLVPAAYTAVTTFHQEMLPTSLLISLAANREGVPFPTVIEVIIMEVTFEILREAGIRLPKAVGTAISIVGALVIGEAAVTAGLVSPAMVIVVSFTAITSFVIPSYNMGIAVRMIRFAFIFLAATFGLYGIVLGAIILVLHLCSLNSFGIPYMASVGPFHLSDQKDSLIRLPWTLMKTRPSYIKTNPTREK